MKSLSFLTVAKLDIQTLEIRSDGAITPNYTLSLVELVGTSHPLGTSEKKENIVLIQQTLSPYFPLKQIQ